MWTDRIPKEILYYHLKGRKEKEIQNFLSLCFLHSLPCQSAGKSIVGKEGMTLEARQVLKTLKGELWSKSKGGIPTAVFIVGPLASCRAPRHLQLQVVHSRARILKPTPFSSSRTRKGRVEEIKEINKMVQYSWVRTLVSSSMCIYMDLSLTNVPQVLRTVMQSIALPSNLLNLIKGIYKNPTVTSYLIEKNEVLSPKDKSNMSTFITPIIFNTILQILAGAIRQEK